MAEWATSLILTELEHARDRGESTVTTRDLQQAVSVGADDFEESITELRDQQRVEEFAPGEWTLVERSEERPPEEPDEDVISRGERVAEARAAGLPDPGATPPGAMELRADGQDAVRMSRAMLDVLEDEALGKIVKAGATAVDGEFTFIVG